MMRLKVLPGDGVSMGGLAVGALGGMWGGETHTRDGGAGFEHRDELVRDGFFEVELLLQDRVRMRRVAHPDPVNRQRRVPLLRRVVHRRVHVAVVPGRVAEPEPVQVVLRDAGHEELDHVAAVGDLDFGLAVAGGDDAAEGGGDERVGGAGVAEDGLDEGGDGGRVVVVEVCGDGEDFVGGGGGEGDAEVGAVWVCGNQRGGQKGSEEEGGRGERLPGGRNGV